MAQRILPIADLSSMIPRWTIKGRVMEKSTMQNFSRTGGGAQGKLFSCDIMDVRGDSIRAKFWGDAADKFNPVIVKGNIYTFRNGRVTVANKRFNNLPHNYELTFDTSSEIVGVKEEDEGGDGKVIPKQRKLAFMTLRDVKNCSREMPFMVDVLAVVHEVQPCDTVQSKRDATTLYKRELKVVDASAHLLPVTLWGQWAQMEDFNFESNPVIAFSNLQIKEWRGRVGQSGMSTICNTNYTSTETDELKEWYKQNKQDSSSWSTFTDLSAGVPGVGGENRRPAEEKKISSIISGLDEVDLTEPHLYSFYGVPTQVVYKNRNGEFNAHYPSCPTCKKKVVVEESEKSMKASSQSGRCEQCGKEVTPEYRYNLGVSFADETCGKIVVRLFHEAGLELFKVASNQVHDWNVNGDNKLNQLFQFDGLWNQMCKVVIRATIQSYQGEERKNVIVVSLERMDPDTYSVMMLNKIRTNWLPNATSVSESRKTKKDRDGGLDTLTQSTTTTIPSPASDSLTSPTSTDATHTHPQTTDSTCITPENDEAPNVTPGKNLNVSDDENPTKRSCTETSRSNSAVTTPNVGPDTIDLPVPSDGVPVDEGVARESMSEPMSEASQE